MLNKERHYAILTWLNRYERATVNQLAKVFNVTRETIRSDLNLLAQEGGIERCHGGAIIKRRIFHTQSVNNLDSNIIHFFDSAQSRKTIKSRHKGRKMKGKVCILGSFNVDIIANVDRFPQSGESIFSENTIIGPGGKGANQALAVSKCNVKTHLSVRWVTISLVSWPLNIFHLLLSTASRFIRIKIRKPAPRLFMFVKVMVKI